MLGIALLKPLSVKSTVTECVQTRCSETNLLLVHGTAAALFHVKHACTVQ